MYLYSCVILCQTKYCCCGINFQIHQFLLWLKWWHLEALFVSYMEFLPRSRASCCGVVPWGYADCGGRRKRSAAVSSNGRNSFTARDMDPTWWTSVVICHWRTAWWSAKVMVSCRVCSNILLQNFFCQSCLVSISLWSLRRHQTHIHVM